MPDRRIRGQAGKAIRAAALQSHAQMRKIGSRAGKSVSFSQSLESLTNRTGEHGKLRTAFLLFENYQRLIEVRVSAFDLLPQNIHLRVLASQTEHGSSGDIGMIDVPRNQSAEIGGVFPRPATAAFVQKKLNAIDVRKQPVGLQFGAVPWLSGNPDLFSFPFPIELG